MVDGDDSQLSLFHAGLVECAPEDGEQIFVPGEISDCVVVAHAENRAVGTYLFAAQIALLFHVEFFDEQTVSHFITYCDNNYHIMI